MPPIPAITLHSHVDLDADPVRLNDESFLLVRRCKARVFSGNSQRFVDLAGNCFLRVESDQRLQYDLDYVVAEKDGLADYHPGRDLSDRSIAFAAGTEQRHQFKDDGIFIYESSEDDDPAGELRTGSTVISYDLHTGLDSTTFPVTSGSSITYTDVPANAVETEILDTAKELLLQDIFHGESNLDDDFTVSAYDGDPAGAGTLLHTITEVDPWVPIGIASAGDPMQWYAQPSNALVFNQTGSTRSVSHFRLARGANVLCDVALDSPVSIPANTTLRVPAANISISLFFNWGPNGTDVGNAGDNEEQPSYYFLRYCLGGTRLQYIPEACFDLEIYSSDPGGNPVASPLETFRIAASATYWTIGGSGTTVDPALLIVGDDTSPSGWSYTNVVLRVCNQRVWVINQTGSFTITTGSTYSSATVPALDIDA